MSRATPLMPASDFESAPVSDRYQLFAQLRQEGHRIIAHGLREQHCICRPAPQAIKRAAAV